jgi:hypothetical protein
MGVVNSGCPIEAGVQTLVWRKLAEINLDRSPSLAFALGLPFFSFLCCTLFSAGGSFLGFPYDTVFLGIIVFGVCAGGVCWFLVR